MCYAVQHVEQQTSYAARLAMLSFRVGVRTSPYLAATPQCLTAKIHNWEHSLREQETQGHFHYQK